MATTLTRSQSPTRIVACVILANILLTVPTAAYASSILPALMLRTAPSQAQHTTGHFQPTRIANAHTGTPTGYGQVLWPTTQAAWAWTPGWPAKPNGGFFAHTTNGGKTWLWYYTAHTSWYQLASSNPRAAWLFGQETPALEAKHPNPPLVWLHTSNGGTTWTKWVLRTPPGGRGTAVFPHSGFDAMGQVVGGRFWWSHAGGPWQTVWSKGDKITTVAAVPGGGEAVALKTASDATALFRMTIGPTGQISVGSAEATPGPVTGMDWVTARDGWIWSSSRIWDTSNGGRSWTELGWMPGGLTSPHAMLYMISPARGYATDNRYGNGPPWDATALWTTRNGGRSWRRVKLPKITYHLPNATLPLVGFYVANVKAHNLTLWYGPITQQGVPQRIWTDNWGKTWHRAKNNPPKP